MDEAGLGSDDPDCGKFVARIRDFHVIHDDVMVENLEQFGSLRLIGVDKQVFAPVVNIHVGQNAALRIEQEVVVAMIQRQIANIVGEHAIQPAYPVFPGDHDLGSPIQIEEATGGMEGMQLAGRIAKS